MIGGAQRRVGCRFVAVRADRVGAVLALAAGIVLIFGPVAAAASSLSVGEIAGCVTDAGTGEPIVWVDVHLLDGAHLEFTAEDGCYRVPRVAAGVHEVEFARIGYDPRVVTVEVVAGAVARIDIALTARPFELPSAEILGRHSGPQMEEEGRAVNLRGNDLAAKLGGTVAATLADEPGLAERTMGPAPARPVVRGLSGERLLVLEDGVSTGDLSATSPDHAVVIDPLSAHQVEVVRGPAALAFGSSVLGGVVNVDRGYVPAARLDAVHGRIQTQGESVSRSRALQAEIGVPWGRQVVRGSVSVRGAEDVTTPAGEIGNTAVDTWNGTLGVSRFGGWGHVGVAGSYFDTEYGIPGGFLGGHRNGADILADRRHAAVAAELLPRWTGVESIELQSSYSRYFQEERESNGSCGVSFGVINYDSGIRLHLDDDAPGPLGTGSVGVALRTRDYASGCFSFTPPTDERSFGGFLYQHCALGEWEFGGALRLDHRAVEPAYADTNKAGAIRPRRFTGMSGSFSMARPLGHGFRAEVVLSRSFRPPSLEELFSDGPHLAAFAFEVGNADLGAETGLGLEANLGWAGELGGRAARIEVSGYRNDVRGYIHAVDTGEIEYGSGEDGYLARWQFRGVRAVLTGVEGSAALELGRVDLAATVSYVRGTRTRDDRPLPLMPPLSGRVEVGSAWGAFRTTLATRGAAAQKRLGEFEARTAAHLVWDASLEWSHLGAGTLHGVVLRLENAGDAEYRNHLSRIKSILPESGRNLALLYRVGF